MFKNCNYPNKCIIPKGKPKEIKPKAISLEIKKGNMRLIALCNGDIYFVTQGYYFGIELPKFLVRNIFGVNIFETIGKINAALLEWGGGRGRFTTLVRQEEDLLRIYLLTIR